jgi:hypothetical protein
MRKRAPSDDLNARKQLALRARLARSRRKRGEVIVRVIIEENPVIEALRRSLVEQALGPDRRLVSWLAG